MSVENVEQNVSEVESPRAFDGVGETVRGVLSAALLAGEAMTAPVTGVIATGSELITQSAVVSPVIELVQKMVNIYLASPVDEGAITMGTAGGQIDENLPSRRSRRKRNQAACIDDLLGSNVREQFLSRRPRVFPNRR